ncbi:MAG: prolipoprotein diacylglyceryl transferase [Candidatus Fournierella pullistercoris]|uniref:Phosphatidylglycerol--prolipoprotein diacylglyceryl transferase n=1 Tax=Candidatus Allofournierella pullistercoris TaxID=2838597 RepID=A0A948T2P4_9FIRM|nr:prolipoprotein diacylglyceryl transferase [Candidatus Fournierella pullistercoris]
MTTLVQFPGLGLELEISRAALTIGDFTVYWYGVLIAAGLILGSALAFRYTVDFGLDEDRFTGVLVVGTILSIICARAYYVAFSPVPYESLWDMINIREGGLAIYGGVLGALVFGALACKWFRQPFLPTLDVVSMGFLVGQAIGRWGNFFNQEAFGTNTTLPWGMYSEKTSLYLMQQQATLAEQGVFVDPLAPVHPTFLYESLWCLVGLGILLFSVKRRRFNGQLALEYAVWYGAGRFWIEGLRTDSLMLPFGGIRVSQLVAAVSVLAAGIALVVLWNRNKKNQLMVELSGAEQVRNKLSEALKPHQELLERCELNTMEPQLAYELPASASHKEFVEAQKALTDFSVSDWVNQQVELAHEMEESVRQENERFSQLSQQEGQES